MSGIGEMADWSAVRREYEMGAVKIDDIARRHGVTIAQIRYRRERDGWPMRHPRRANPNELVERMLMVLDHQIKRFEEHMKTGGGTGSGEKDAQLLTNMAKTLEKLLELGAADGRSQKAEPVPPIEDLRAELAKRLEDRAKP